MLNTTATTTAPLFDTADHAPRPGVRCACCGQPLSHPTSVALGVGPVCRRRSASAIRIAALDESLEALHEINAAIISAPPLPMPVQLPLFAA